MFLYVKAIVVISVVRPSNRTHPYSSNIPTATALLPTVPLSRNKRRRNKRKNVRVYTEASQKMEPAGARPFF
jgi:hypothetical protein